MDTSSIFANIKITDPQKAEKFIEALEASANAPKIKLSAPVIPTVTDPDKIRKLMAKRLKSNFLP